MNKKVRIILYIVLGIIVVVALELVVFKVVSKQPTVPPDSGSVSRMQKLNNVLKSKFGNSWPFVLIFILLLLLAIFALLYFVLKKETVTWNVSDRNAKILSRVGITLAILISLTLVGLGVYAVIKERKEYNQQQEDAGDFSTQTKGKQFLELAGLVLVLIVVLALIGWAIHHHFKYEKSLKA
jgi:H+/gluconate symporter-like permease